MSLAVGVLWLSAAAESARAQVVKPFKIVGGGIGPTGIPLPGQPARMFWSIGQATQLGRYCGEGAVGTDSADPVVDPEGNLVGFKGEFGSGIDANGDAIPFVFTGANGDQLVTVFGREAYGAEEPGTFELTIVGLTPEGAPIVTAYFIAEFVAQPKESTGKFAGATGSWIMYARSAPFVLGSTDPLAYWWQGQGALTFPKKKSK